MSSFTALSSAAQSNKNEQQVGYSVYEPSYVERLASVGTNISEGGFRGAFQIAQPSSLMYGVLIVMIFSFICMIVALTTDMSGNKVFVGISLGLPWAIMLAALFFQWLENSNQDNKYVKFINNNLDAFKTVSIDQS